MQKGWSNIRPTESGFYWLKTKYLEEPEIIRIDRKLIFISGSEKNYYPEPEAEFFYPKLTCPS